jgi:hypothetical protein
MQLNPIVVQEPMEEVARGHPEPPLMEVCEADDVAGRGFGSSSLLGTIHSNCTAFITGWRNPCSSVKLQQPHRSIERGDKALEQQRRWRRLRGEFSISLSLSVAYLPRQMENTSARKAKNRGVQGKGKTTRLKRAEME